MHFLKLLYRCIYAGEYCTRFEMDICKDQVMEFNHDMPVTEIT